MREFLKDQQKEGIIEKWGMSLYLPHELNNSYMNVLQIPCDPCWFDSVRITSLYAKVYIRSYYNHFLKNYRDNKKYEYWLQTIYQFKKNENIDFVIGCDNLEQLEQNLEVFGK